MAPIEKESTGHKYSGPPIAERDGGHKYPGPSGACEHGCGCWISLDDSGGPSGLDPFGLCSRNPKNAEDGLASFRSVSALIRETERLVNGESKS